MGPGGIIVHARVACFFPWRLLKNAAADAPEIDAIQLVGQDRWNYPDTCLRNQIVPSNHKCVGALKGLRER
jgi:hypothetical protein